MMSDPEAAQAEEIAFHLFKLRDPGERAALVDRACAGDEALRAEVEKIAAECAEVDQFFEESRPTLDRDVEIIRRLAEGTELRPAESPDFDADQFIGTRIGRYR